MIVGERTVGARVLFQAMTTGDEWKYYLHHDDAIYGPEIVKAWQEQVFLKDLTGHMRWKGKTWTVGGTFNGMELIDVESEVAMYSLAPYN